MSDIKRYDMQWDHDELENVIVECDDGDYVAFHAHDMALAAKDARVADLEALLREVATSGYSTGLRKRIDEALAANRLETLNESETISLEDMEARFGVEPATHSEDGREAPTVVGWLQTDATRNPSMWVSRHRQVSERDIDEGALVEPLMTVAQHERITKQLREEAATAKARQDHAEMVGDDLSRIVAAKDWENRQHYAPAAVVMPERRQYRKDSEGYEIEQGEEYGWNACCDEVARLNRRTVPAGLIEKAANLLDAHMCTGCAESEICCRPEVRDTARELRAMLGKS